MSKDGWLTQAAEHVPGPNLVVAAAHAGAGNAKEAGRAAIKGFGTGVGLAVGAAGGPAAGVAVGAALHGAATQYPKAFDDKDK